MGEKTLGNTDANGTKKNVKDVVFWGDGDLMELISKASSKNEKWMKSTKAMEIKGLGVLVQATTQQDKNVAEAIHFIKGAEILRVVKDGKVIKRVIVKSKKSLLKRLLELLGL